MGSISNSDDTMHSSTETSCSYCSWKENGAVTPAVVWCHVYFRILIMQCSAYSHYFMCEVIVLETSWSHLACVEFDSLTQIHSSATCYEGNLTATNTDNSGPITDILIRCRHMAWQAAAKKTVLQVECTGVVVVAMGVLKYRRPCHSIVNTWMLSKGECVICLYSGPNYYCYLLFWIYVMNLCLHIIFEFIVILFLYLITSEYTL